MHHLLKEVIQPKSFKIKIARGKRFWLAQKLGLGLDSNLPLSPYEEITSELGRNDLVYK